MNEPTAIDQDVLALKNEHPHIWKGASEVYWYYKLLKELRELRLVLTKPHKHTTDHVLKQIAAICLNWLEMRVAETPDGRRRP